MCRTSRSAWPACSRNTPGWSARRARAPSPMPARPAGRGSNSHCGQRTPQIGLDDHRPQMPDWGNNAIGRISTMPRLTMPRLSGTAFVGAVLSGATLALTSWSAAAQTTTLTMSSWVSPSHLLTKDVLAVWGQQVEKATNGRVKLQMLPKHPSAAPGTFDAVRDGLDRKSTRLNSSHLGISYAVFC